MEGKSFVDSIKYCDPNYCSGLEHGWELACRIVLPRSMRSDSVREQLSDVFENHNTIKSVFSQMSVEEVDHAIAEFDSKHVDFKPGDVVISSEGTRYLVIAFNTKCATFNAIELTDSKQCYNNLEAKFYTLTSSHFDFLDSILKNLITESKETELEVETAD